MLWSVIIRQIYIYIYVYVYVYVCVYICINCTRVREQNGSDTRVNVCENKNDKHAVYEDVYERDTT